MVTLYEFDQKSYEAAMREEGREEGREGIILKLLKNGMSAEKLAELADCSHEYIYEVADKKTAEVK